MIYRRHLAQAFSFFTKARNFDVSPYEPDGSLDLSSYAGMHIVSEGGKYFLYADPNHFGAAPANEFTVTIASQSSATGRGAQFTCNYQQEGSATLRVFDYNKSNSIFATILYGNDTLPVLTFGSNGTAQGQKVFLRGGTGRTFNATAFCPYMQQLVEISLIVNRDEALISYNNSVGWSYTFDLPEDWRGARYFASVETTGDIYPYSARIRTAAHDLGQFGLKQSGLSVFDVQDISIPASGEISDLHGRHINYGTVSFGEREKAALGAIPFGFHGAEPASHFAAIAKDSATITVDGSKELLSGSNVVQMSTSGYTYNDAYGELNYTNRDRAYGLEQPAPQPGSVYQSTSSQSLIDSYYNAYSSDPFSGVFNYRVFIYKQSSELLFLYTRLISVSGDAQPTFSEQQQATFTSAGAIATQLAGRTISKTHVGFLPNLVGCTLGVKRNATSTEQIIRHKADILPPVFNEHLQQFQILFAGTTSYWETVETNFDISSNTINSASKPIADVDNGSYTRQLFSTGGYGAASYEITFT